MTDNDSFDEARIACDYSPRDEQETRTQGGRFKRHTELIQRLLKVPTARIELFKEELLEHPESTAKQVHDHDAIRFFASCPLRCENGTQLGVLSIMDSKPRALKANDFNSLQDIAALISSEIAALSLAATDELTGLANRRAFYLRSDQLLRLCARENRQATLLMIDLDGFKAINDAQGHAAGDGALKTFAKLLEESFRHSDVIARLGGDEFGVLLTDSEEQSAWRCVERLRETVNDLSTCCENPAQLAFSAGVIQWNGHKHDDISALMADADLMMYARKRAKQSSQQEKLCYTSPNVVANAHQSLKLHEKRKLSFTHSTYFTPEIDHYEIVQRQVNHYCLPDTLPRT